MRIGLVSFIAMMSVAFVGVAAAHPQQIGFISYWGPSIDAYDVIPDSSVAVFNPDNGVLVSKGQKKTTVSNIAAYRAIVKRATARNVAMLGYVPTGYFRHNCNEIGRCQKWDRIEAQVQSYFAEIPGTAGIFFDETSPATWDCNAFGAEYQRLREIVRRYSVTALIAFNAGVPDNCVANAVQAGEIAVLFEGDPKAYVQQAGNLSVSAKTTHLRGAKVWHLLHSLSSNDEIAQMTTLSQKHGADYFYVTFNSGDWQSGVNTWGR